jgi:hypothetical protein
MPTYVHYYRCHCIDWGKFVTETSGNSSPGFVGKNHWQVDAKSRCPIYLRFDHTEEISQGITSSPRLKEGIERLLKFAPITTASTISVMWDEETQTWYQGKSGHNKPQGNVPVHISNYIGGLQVDKGDWAFGWNCGEVECIIQAYNQGKNNVDLTGCFFIAMNAAKRRLYGGCRTCKNWISHFHGKSNLPH